MTDADTRQRRSPPRGFASRPWRGIGVLLLAHALTMAPARADPPVVDPPTLLMDTAGQGPALHVTAFRVDPDAARRVAQGWDSPLGRSILAAARPDEPDWLARWIAEDYQNTILHGWEAALVGIDVALLGASVFNVLQSVETMMVGVSAAASFGKFALHISRGEVPAAFSAAAQGTVSFAAQYYGLRSLQAGSVAAAVLNLALERFGTEAHEQRREATDLVYRRYYRERGRSTNDWKLLLYRLLEARPGPEVFAAALNDEVTSYIRQAWEDPYFDELMAGASSDVVGITRYAALPESLRRSIEAAHRQTLLELLQTDVLPELAHRAWLLSLADLAHTANMDLRPALNAVWEIALEAHGLTEPARFTVHLPAGGDWSGMLEPGTLRQLRMTTLAFLRAGGPHRITLETPGGSQTRPVIWQDRQARVVFGLPPVGQVAGFALTEGPGQCEVTRRLPGGGVEHDRATTPAPPPGRLDVGSGPDGIVVLGRFSEPGGWSGDAQTFRAEGSALRAEAPMTDGLARIEGCAYTLVQGDGLVDGQCRSTRLSTRAERLSPPSGTPEAAALLPRMLFTEHRCVHDATMTLTDFYLPADGGWTRYPMDGEAGRILMDALRDGMEQGFSLQ